MRDSVLPCLLTRDSAFPLSIRFFNKKKQEKRTADIAQRDVWLGLLTKSESETVIIYMIIYRVFKSKVKICTV